MMDDMFFRLAVGLICAGASMYYTKPTENPKDDPRGLIAIGIFIAAAVYYLYITSLFLLIVGAYLSPRIILVIYDQWKVFEVPNNGAIIDEPRTLVRHDEEPIDFLREHFRNGNQHRDSERETSTSE